MAIQLAARISARKCALRRPWARGMEHLADGIVQGAPEQLESGIGVLKEGVRNDPSRSVGKPRSCGLVRQEDRRSADVGDFNPAAKSWKVPIQLRHRGTQRHFNSTLTLSVKLDPPPVKPSTRLGR